MMNTIKHIFSSKMKKFMKNIKVFIAKPVTIISLVLIGVLGILWVLDKGSLDKYYGGIFTEVIGIIITVIFVQWMFDRKALKDEKQQEFEQIKKFHRVLNKYIQEYTFYFNCVTTPMDERSGNNSNLKENFEFSEMCDLHMPSLSFRKGLAQSSIRSFYQYEQAIREYMINVLTQSKFKHYKEIDRLFLEFINASINGDYKDFILANERNKQLFDSATDIIKNHSQEYIKGFESGEKGYVSNAATPYYILYKLLIEEKRIITEYQSLIKSILD